MSDFSLDGFILHTNPTGESKEWLKGPKITSENLKNGTGCIERLARPEWVKSPNSAGGAKSGGSAKTEQNPAIMPFGKYKGQLLVDILEENPGYLRWAAENIDGFEAKLTKAGINLDEI